MKRTGAIVVMYFFLPFLLQTSNSFKFQEIAHDLAGRKLTNRAIIVKASIHDSMPTGPILYQEIFKVKTDKSGKFIITVGTGTTVSGVFATIPWQKGLKYLQEEINFGKGYQDLGSFSIENPDIVK